MRSRVHRIFQNVPEGIDAVVLHNATDAHVDQSFFYATDLVSGGTFERAVAVAHRDGSLDILAPSLEETSARRAPEASVSVYQKLDDRKAWLTKTLGGATRIGVNMPELVTSDYLALKATLPNAELVDVSSAVANARAVKDSKELARIRKACEIVSEVADEIPGLLRDGMREYELSAEIAYAMQKRGASGPSFDTIVAFGVGSAEPHYHPGDVPLGKSQFVLCDFGARYHKYASDLTRTWIRGPETKELRAIYDTVLAAEEAAIATVRAGVKGADVHLAADAVIDASPWKGRFIHSVGHALGLAVHDGPALHPRNADFVLEEGMVITIEPGIYVPGLGGVRIEDDVVVTKAGCEVLTTARRDSPVV